MKKFIKILAVVLIMAGISCGVVAFLHYRDEQNAGEEYEVLREQVVDPVVSEEDQEEPEEPELLEPSVIEEEGVDCPIDFSALQEENPDIYAWIQIPGTCIDYPILCRQGDNGYYLTHTYTGKTKKEGAIFTEDLNSLDFSDPNTVIYGHNMKNGSMFRELHKYKDRAFFEENPDVIIYTPQKMLRYHIFAAYTSDDSHILKSNDFTDEDIFLNYLQKILDRKKNMSDNVSDDIELSSESKLITLSTCTSNAEKRFLVQAILNETKPIKEEK